MGYRRLKKNGAETNRRKIIGGNVKSVRKFNGVEMHKKRKAGKIITRYSYMNNAAPRPLSGDTNTILYGGNIRRLAKKANVLNEISKAFSSLQKGKGTRRIR